jgi:hypothetical protein
MATASLTRQIRVAGTGYGAVGGSGAAFDKTINILPGTLSIQDMDDHRGGDMGLPRVKVAVGQKITFQCLVDADGTTNYPNVADLMSYVSMIGEGTVTVTDVTHSSILAKYGLLDVRVTGKAVQVAEIEIKGTNN